jgi:hypothetical protein
MRWFMRSFAVLVSPFAHWVEIVRSEKLDSFGQRLGAIAVLFRIRLWRFLEAQRLLMNR